MLTCKKCGETKEERYFYIAKNTLTGYNGSCKDCMNKQKKQYYETHKEEHKTNRDKWTEANKDKVRQYKNEWNQAKYQFDPVRRVHSNVSTVIRLTLRGKKNYKKWESLVGYTKEELMKHLESLFQEGMTWDNYGDWHIDHIKPRVSFDIKELGDEEFKKCWSLDNLQPLWKDENLSKGPRIHEKYNNI